MKALDLITFTHVYMENNCQADIALKAGLLLDLGIWKVKERLGDHAFEYYHRPFFDMVVTWCYAVGAWTFCFFDGASQNNLCGGGAILNLDENQSFELITGLGVGSNNRAELLSLQILLIFAAEKGCRTIRIFGDSLNVINWVKKIQTCSDLLLCNILLSIWEVMTSFDMISFTHVYRENNC